MFPCRETDDKQTPPLPLPEIATEHAPPSAPCRRKATLLPQINQLALEGHSCREIGARLRIGKTTINRCRSRH